MKRKSIAILNYDDERTEKITKKIICNFETYGFNKKANLYVKKYSHLSPQAVLAICGFYAFKCSLLLYGSSSQRYFCSKSTTVVISVTDGARKKMLVAWMQVALSTHDLKRPCV